MSIRPIPCFEVACDEDGCDATTGTQGEFSGWGDSGYAETEWIDGDNQVIGDKHYCYKHRKPECCGCDETSNLTEHTDGENYCPKCLADEIKRVSA